MPDIYINSITLTYSSATVLSASPNVGTTYNGCKALVTMRYAAGMPTQQVTRIYVSEISSGSLTITAQGSGFVSGHALGVNLVIIKG